MILRAGNPQSVTSLKRCMSQTNKNKYDEITCCKSYTSKERRKDEEGFNMTFDINATLEKHVKFVLDRMDEIETCKELSIHQMADLERYANTLKDLAQTHEAFNN